MRLSTDIISEFTDYERTVLSWGITVTLAYMITYFYPEQASSAWTLALILNSLNYLQMHGISRHIDLNVFWMMSVFAAFLLTKTAPYQIVLLVTGALTFYYTSLKTEGASSRIYNTASLLNIATLIIYFLGSGQIEIYLLLSFIQGGPMLVDFFAN